MKIDITSFTVSMEITAATQIVLIQSSSEDGSCRQHLSRPEKVVTRVRSEYGGQSIPVVNKYVTER
ncbi:hypothetical protein AVEN_174328-1, partial [Araneus ventricosus]